MLLWVEDRLDCAVQWNRAVTFDLMEYITMCLDSTNKENNGTSDITIYFFKIIGYMFRPVHRSSSGPIIYTVNSRAILDWNIYIILLKRTMLCQAQLIYCFKSWATCFDLYTGHLQALLYIQ